MGGDRSGSTDRFSAIESPLRFLLQDVSPVRFLTEYWGRKPLHVPGNGRDFNTLLALPWRQVRSLSTHVRAGRRGADGRFHQISARPADLRRRAPRSGVTICSDHADRWLTAFSDRLRVELGLTGRTSFVQCYESSHKSGLGGHFDNSHVFVLQVEGEKRWLVSKKPLVPYPESDAVVDNGSVIVHHRTVRAPKRSACADVIMRPGDFLYLPPGAWHRPIARGHSMALSLSPVNVSMGQFVTRLIEQRLDPDWQWRQLLPPLYDPTARGAFPAARLQLRQFISQLRACVAELDEDTLLRAWLSALPLPSTSGRSRRRARWTPTTRLQHVWPGALRLLADDDAVTLFHGSFAARMNIAGLPLARWVATHASFTLGEAAGAVRPALDLRDVQALAHLLVEGGVVRVL